jgi:hypothetical protein
VWCSVCRLKAEGKIQQDKWIVVECSVVGNIQVNPANNNCRLGNQKEWGTKEASKTFCSLGEPVTAEGMGQMGVFSQETEMVRRD